MRFSSSPRVSRLGPWVVVGAMLALFYAMAVSAAAQKSMTFDELAHLTAGYTYSVFNDYRLHPENGNWPQRLAAVPAVVGGATFPTLDQPAWTASNVYAIGDQFLYGSGNDAGTLLGRGRAMMALLGVALGLVVFAWARRLVSPAGAWVSLLLFAFSPTFLAHAPLVTSDMASALFYTTATAALWHLLHRVTPVTVIAAGLLTGGAVLSKLSGPLLFPVALVMLAARIFDGRPLTAGVGGRTFEFRGRGRQLAVLLGAGLLVALVTWCLVWASFGFRYSAFAASLNGSEAFLGSLPERSGPAGWLLANAHQYSLLPEAYLYGLDYALATASERAAFLRGAFRTTGWWWYFPYAFAVKTTIPEMVVGLLALAALVVQWRRGAAADGSLRARVCISLYAGTPLLALIVVYGAFALVTNLNIGHRHLLPIYPAISILAGGAAFWVHPLFDRTPRPASPSRREQRKRGPDHNRSGGSVRPRVAGMAVVALLAWHVGESLSIRPSYLAYFNQLVGGPSQGFRHLADSSLDWGQDLPALARWLGTNAPRQPGAGAVYLSYFGTARPEYYGVNATRLAGFLDQRPPQPPEPLGAGIYCVSATMMNVVGHVLYGPESEPRYRAALQDLAALARASESDQAWSALMRQTGEKYWERVFAEFDRLRTGRLLAYLRGRQPDAMADYTILIYRLTDADVEQALFLNADSRGPSR